jgi:hypothetical protein
MKHSWFKGLIAATGFLVVLAGLNSAPAAAQARKTYQHLVVQAFDTPGGDFPADFADALRRDVVRQLEGTKRFTRVTFLEKGEELPSDADLVLTGTITNFSAGSRAARYMVPGVGATKIRATITFTDPGINKVLLEAQVHGSVHFGVFGGSSMGAVKQIAKQLAKDVKKQLA